MKLMYLCISSSYKKLGQFNRPSIYECTRKYWNLRSLKKALEADYVVAVGDRIIRGVFKKTTNWQLVRNFPELHQDAEVLDNPDYLERFAFIGEEVTDSEILAAIHKDYREHPFRYYGGIEHYNF